MSFDWRNLQEKMDLDIQSTVSMQKKLFDNEVRPVGYVVGVVMSDGSESYIVQHEDGDFAWALLGKKNDSRLFKSWKITSKQ